MQQNACAPLKLARQRLVFEQPARKRRQLQGELAAHRGHPLRCMLLVGHHIHKGAVSKVADIEHHRMAFRPAAVKDGDVGAVIRIRTEDIMAAAHHAGKGQHIALRRERQKFASLQGVVFVAGLDDGPVVFPQFFITACPLVRTAVGRVLESFHADFITIIDARHARISHLEHSRHL